MPTSDTISNGHLTYIVQHCPALGSIWVYAVPAYNDIFTVRRNARIASVVLATAIPSVCLSVRLSHAGIVSKQTTARSTVQFALSDSKMCLVL